MAALRTILLITCDSFSACFSSPDECVNSAF
uniref:Uncharacterized protein n=1 Tax=Setaria viridis TaxID=4556 RepID=A0A4U6WJU2_SETVI|nr:hypothetical protein SEVIR_1G114133v2 [Setaria viridis]